MSSSAANRIAISGGDFSTHSEELSLTQPVGRGTLQLGADDFGTAGFPLVAAEDRGPVDVAAWSRHEWYSARWLQPVGANADLTITARTFDKRRGNGTSYQGNRSRGNFGSATLNARPDKNFTWNATVYAQDQTFSSTFSSVNATRTAETPASDQYAVPATAYGAGWSGVWLNGDRSRTSAGVDFRDVSGETRERYTYSNGDFTRQRIAGGAQDFAGVFALHEQQLGPAWRANVGARLDFWQDRDGHRHETDRATGAVLRNDHYARLDGVPFSSSAGLIWQPSTACAVRRGGDRSIPALYLWRKEARLYGAKEPCFNACLPISALHRGERSSGAMPFARMNPSHLHPKSYPIMKTPFAVSVSARVFQRCIALFSLTMLCFCSASISPAQVAGNGTITGQILNTDTGQYVRSATVHIEGTDVTAVSEDGGYYRLANAPVGEVKVVVTYTGYPTATALVQVTAGATARRNFELSSAAPAPGVREETVKLDRFVVSSQRVGESKALMEQRNSQDIKNVVSSEQFGDIVGGNIAEFLKNVPGIELDIDRGEATSVRLRGLPSQYTSVTLDGMPMTSADANGAVAPNTRALNFQAFSLDSLESIEINKTVSADVDANAPAGTINLRPKRAFDLVGRRVVLETHATAHSEHFGLGKSYGPREELDRKIWPGASIQYSDVVLNKRLGFNLTLSAHKQFSEHQEMRNTYNYTTTATDTRPIVPTAIGSYTTPRFDYRDTVSFTTDFKATPNLVLSLALLYNSAELLTWQRESIFNLGARNTILGDDPLTSFTVTATNASVTSNPTAILKRNQTISATPKFEFRKGNLRVEGKFMVGEAKSWYDPWGRGGAVRDLLGGSTPTNSGVRFTGARSSPDEGWNLTQTGGLDWSDGASFTTGVARITDGRGARTSNYTADVTAELSTFKGVPIVWKLGAKRSFQWRKYWDDTQLGNYALTGAPARGGWAAYTSPFGFETGPGGNNLGASITSLSGGTVWMGYLEGIGTLLRDHPEQFTHPLSVANLYTAISNRRELEETIDAAFLMATTKIKDATLRAGFRWEDTTTDVLEFNPLTRDEMTAAGYATDAATSRATTIEGLQYQYFTNPKIHRKGSYDNLFPSASLKYKFPWDIDFLFGFSSTIRRPTFGDITGVWVINDTAKIVTAPNRNLTPEKSRNFALRLAKYFEPRGMLALNFFQNDVQGLFVRQSGLTAEEFGWTPDGGPDLSNYLFTTTTQGTGVTRLRGMEIEYSQSLNFLPKPLDGFGVRASYTRNYADAQTTLLAPHAFTGGLTYARRKWNVYANYKWTDENVATLATVLRSYKAEGKMDIGGTYRFTRRWSAYFYARNITNTQRKVIEKNTANPDAPWTTNMIFNDGTNWTFGARYIF